MNLLFFARFPVYSIHAIVCGLIPKLDPSCERGASNLDTLLPNYFVPPKYGAPTAWVCRRAISTDEHAAEEENVN